MFGSRIFLILIFFGLLMLHLLLSIIYRHSDFLFIIIFNSKTIVNYWDEAINKKNYAGYSNKEILTLMQKAISNDGSILVVSKVLDILDPKIRTFDLHHPSGFANKKLSLAISENL